jgi:hypothetical protein
MIKGQRGRVAQQQAPFAQAFVHQPEFAAFEVAQAAVYQLGGAARGRHGRAGVLFEQQAGIARGRGGLQGSRAVDAAADDYDIVMLLH